MARPTSSFMTEQCAELCADLAKVMERDKQTEQVSSLRQKAGIGAKQDFGDCCHIEHVAGRRMLPAAL